MQNENAPRTAFFPDMFLCNKPVSVKLHGCEFSIHAESFLALFLSTTTREIEYNIITMSSSSNIASYSAANKTDQALDQIEKRFFYVPFAPKDYRDHDEVLDVLFQVFLLICYFHMCSAYWARPSLLLPIYSRSALIRAQIIINRQLCIP